MTDEALDILTHDMAYTGFDELLVSDAAGSPAQIAQNCKIRLLMVKGEYFNDSTRGNINFQDLATKNNIPAIIDACNKATIKDTPGVVSVNSYSSKYDTTKRTLEVTFSAQTMYGSFTVSNFPQVIL